MKLIYAPTEDFIRLAGSKLSADVAAGSSVTLAVYGNEGMSQNDYVVIGQEGTDTCEIQKISASVTPGTAITVGTLIFAHKQEDPVRVFRYNQRKFYGATSQGGDYTELTSSGSPKTIQVNDPQGTSLEYTGDEGYTYFKSTYYNSTTTDETDIGDSVGMLADESVRYCSLEAIRRQAGLTDNPFVTDGQIEIYRLRAENEVNSYLYNRYVLPLTNQTYDTPEIPYIVENVTVLLAAGYMDYREYGKDGEGVKWLGEARAVLKAVQNGTQRLIGSDMIEFEQKELTQGIQSSSSSGNPDGSSSCPKFGMNKEF